MDAYSLSEDKQSILRNGKTISPHRLLFYIENLQRDAWKLEQSKEWAFEELEKLQSTRSVAR